MHQLDSLLAIIFLEPQNFADLLTELQPLSKVLLFLLATYLKQNKFLLAYYLEVNKYEGFFFRFGLSQNFGLLYRMF